MKLFGGAGADRPMADARQARRILAELSPQELKALDELAHWQESVGAEPSFRPEQRVQLALMIDDAAQPRLRKLGRDYFDVAHASRTQESLVWNRLHEYWRHAAIAFARCVDAFLQGAKGADVAKPLLPIAVVRALRSLAQQVKWQQVRYGPIDTAVWGILNKVYAFAEISGLADAKVAIYPPVAVETTPRQEFLKAAILSACAPDALLPAEVDLAERLIGELAASYTLAHAPARELPYWTDLGLAMTPARTAKPPQPSVGLRCFGPGTALAAVQSLMHKVEASGAIPSTLNLGGVFDAGLVLAVMRHLAANWAPQPPERRHRRHNVKSTLAVVLGFEGVLEALGGAPDATPSARESWVVDNVSAGGFGAIVPQARGGWLKVGTLLAMQPEGGDNWLVGTVRRVSRISEQEARVGIRTLSRAPALSRFTVAGLGEQPGVLLESSASGSGEASIALRAGMFSRRLNLEAHINGRHCIYLPQALAEHGEDYEIARFKELVKES